MNKTTKTITKVALFAALMCILGPLSINIGIIPISLSIFTVFLASYLLNPKEALLAVLVYLLIGAFGLPVFSNFAGGLAKLLGPTGGYLIGFLPMALISSLFIQKNENIYVQFAGMLISLLVCYIFGSIWLAVSADMSFINAVKVGMLPFIALDIIKIILVIIIGKRVKKVIK